MVFKKNFLALGLLTSCAAVYAQEKNSQEIIDVTDKNFTAVVLQAKKPVIIDFWAEWCGPCKAIKPSFEQLAKKYSDNYLFVRVNIDEAKETALNYKIASIPTFVIVKDGVTKGIYVGGIKPENFEAEVKKALEADSSKGPISNTPQMPQEMVLLQAITTNNPTQVKKLIEEGIDVNHVFKFPVPMGPDMGKEMEVTPLCMALSAGNKEIATILLDAGAVLDQKFNYGGKVITAREMVQLNIDETVKRGKEMLAFLDDYTKQKKS